MKATRRGPAPDVLVQEGPEIAQRYAARRREDPSYRFQWRPALFQAVREALTAMTVGHCSYCDSNALDATGIPTVDHFCPKSREEFCELVCSWDNLYLACDGCNRAKREQWEATLLRPDDDLYEFERYFEYRPATGELQPAVLANADDQLRAKRTIEILGLNRPGLRTLRKIYFDLMSDRQDLSLDDFPYRYLLPLIAVATSPGGAAGP